MRKTYLRLGSLLAMLAVGLGAFGAHGLKSVLSAENLATFETGVRYQFYHALGLIAIGILLHFGKKTALKYAAWCFIAGIVLFSGSLYLLSTREATGFGPWWLGPITPLGGLAFIAGWALLFVSSYYHFDRNVHQSN